MLSVCALIKKQRPIISSESDIERSQTERTGLQESEGSSGVFFKETQNVTITAEDNGSGINEIFYYLSEKEFTCMYVKLNHFAVYLKLTIL